MHALSWWPTLIVLGIAAVFDLRERRIPNWLVVPFCISGIVVEAVFRGRIGIERSLLGVALAAAIMGVLYWLGGMGMGDVKLCVAIGAWIGPTQELMALILMGLAGGIIALCWAAYGGFLEESLKGSKELIFGFAKRGLRPHPTLVLSNDNARKMPYAPAIAIGTVLSFFATR